MTGPLRGTAPFFLLTFALTWGLQIPGVLAQRGLPPGDAGAYMPLAGVGILGPLVAATVMSHREGGRATVMALFGGVLKWRVRPRWYAAALLLPGALLMGGLFVLNLAGREGPTGYFPAPGAVAFAIVVSVAEEIGWRGYARPRLQARWGVFGAAALLGVAWYLWHIPMFMGLGVPLYLVFVMLLCFTGGSLSGALERPSARQRSERSSRSTSRELQRAESLPASTSSPFELHSARLP